MRVQTKDRVVWMWGANSGTKHLCHQIITGGIETWSQPLCGAKVMDFGYGDGRSDRKCRQCSKMDRIRNEMLKRHWKKQRAR